MDSVITFMADAGVAEKDEDEDEDEDEDDEPRCFAHSKISNWGFDSALRSTSGVDAGHFNGFQPTRLTYRVQTTGATLGLLADHIPGIGD